MKGIESLTSLPPHWFAYTNLGLATAAGSSREALLCERVPLKCDGYLAHSEFCATPGSGKKQVDPRARFSHGYARIAQRPHAPLSRK